MSSQGQRITTGERHKGIALESLSVFAAVLQDLHLHLALSTADFFAFFM